MNKLLVSLWLVCIGSYCYSQGGSCIFTAAYDTTTCYGKNTICPAAKCPVAGKTYKVHYETNLRYGVNGNQMIWDGSVPVDCYSTCACETDRHYYSHCDDDPTDPNATFGCIAGGGAWCDNEIPCTPQKVTKPNEYFRYCY